MLQEGFLKHGRLQRGRPTERRGEGLISNAAEQQVLTCGYLLTEYRLCFAVKLEDFPGSGTENAAASAFISTAWFYHRR